MKQGLHLTDEELLALLANGEDQTTERKSKTDTGDILKTLVAFANSTPLGYPAVLFIGVFDDGRIQDMTGSELDSAQKSLRREAEKAYPPIPYFPRIVNAGQNKLLAVIVPGSPERPHFGGPSYVRQGSESPRASAEQFQALIDERSSKVYQIRKWIGKTVGVHGRTKRVGQLGPRVSSVGNGRLVDCNQFWVVLETDDGWGLRLRSFPLPALDLDYCPIHENLILICDHEYWSRYDSCARKDRD